MRAAALTILAKDLRLRLRDRSVLLFAVVVPLGLTVLFSFILPDIGELDLTAAVLDQDGGQVARGFVDGVVPALADDGILTLAEVVDRQDAEARLAVGEIDAVWVIPSGTSDAVTSGAGAALEVLVADGRTLQGEIARSVASAYATQVEQVALAVATATVVSPSNVGADVVPTTVAAAMAQEPLQRLAVSTSGSGEGMDFTSYLAAGMAAFFVFFTVQFGVIGLLEEKQQGTMARLLAAPIRPAAIQVGKVLGSFVLGIGSMTVLALASHLLLGADWGPPLGVAILIVSLVLAAIGLMALVGSFARTAEQAGNFQSIVAVVLGMLGGVFFPVPGDSAFLRFFSQISPHGWFLRGLTELVNTGAWVSVLPAATAIVAFGVVAAVPAVAVQRRRQAW
jgi:ABC-2 type transport system permease protein